MSEAEVMAQIEEAALVAFMKIDRKFRKPGHADTAPYLSLWKSAFFTGVLWSKANPEILAEIDLCDSE